MSDYFKTHTADEIIDKAWTFVPKGTPETKSEFKNFKKGIKKASQKKDLSEITQSRIEEGFQYIKNWKKRRFVGSYWLLVISILSIAFFGYQMYGRYTAGEPVFLLESGGTQAWLSNVFGFFYLIGFLLYFWSQRAPAWMVYMHGLAPHDDGMEIAMKPKRFIMYDKAGNTIKDRHGNTQVYEKTDWTTTIIFLIIKYVTLPFASLIGFFRYYVFYV